MFPHLATSSNPRFFIHPLSHVPQHLERVASFRRTRRLQASWLGPSIGYIVALKFNISQDSTHSSTLSRLAINLQRVYGGKRPETTFALQRLSQNEDLVLDGLSLLLVVKTL